MGEVPQEVGGGVTSLVNQFQVGEGCVPPGVGRCVTRLVNAPGVGDLRIVMWLEGCLLSLFIVTTQCCGRICPNSIYISITCASKYLNTDLDH